MRFNAVFRQTNQRLDVHFGSTDQRLDATFENFQQITVLEDAEVYDGDYEVTPQVTPQVLQTRLKLMREDLRVQAIPYYDVGNTAGGSTVYIGTLDAVLGQSRLGVMTL
jgi:hypothetical protein